MSYEQFLKSKVIIAEHYGFDPAALSEMLNPHQVDIVNWTIRGGRRAVFASFGLGKTFMQLELARQCMLKENKPFLICCPLGVVGEFRRDNRKLKTGYDIEYITDSDSVDEYAKPEPGFQKKGKAYLPPSAGYYRTAHQPVFHGRRSGIGPIWRIVQRAIHGAEKKQVCHWDRAQQGLLPRRGFLRAEHARKNKHAHFI